MGVKLIKYMLYNIEKILDRRKVNGRFEYKIKWEGCPISESTWETKKDLETVKWLVEEYNNAHPIFNRKKSFKFTHIKRKSSFINKKRKEENGQIHQNEKLQDESLKIKGIIPKVNVNDNPYTKKYIIDDSLKNVVTVKQKNKLLMAIVDKIDSNGEIKKTYISTKKLRKINPWILINFYESKIQSS